MDVVRIWAVQLALGRIGSIIVNGLLVTSNDNGTDVSKIYAKTKLETLGGVPLEEYLFEDFGSDIKHGFDSEEGNLGMCTKVSAPDEPLDSCLDCRDFDS
ncbi:hypothetical protein RF11_10249 [Thelohanellus kitauei]|uniref:Uncharacterized protein n=1 Tax=Thelohanellus kitauei TaxID=669202 RepID=A0A0C2MXX1_THEKT|nr:hypothetical protein RF11_10249 [Thelohanellus kitauei]